MSLRLVFCQLRVGKKYAWRGFRTRTSSSLPGVLNVWRDRDRRQTSESTWPVYTGAAVTTGLILGWYLFHKKSSSVVGLPQLEAAENEEKERKVSLRERRYKDFASVVYRGEPYMTGRDFLEAVTKKSPRCEY